MPRTNSEDLAFDPAVIGELDEWLQPLKRLMSPVALGLENVPREGAVLLTGNHTIYGLLDIPMLGLEIWESTGRAVRGLADHNHFALPVWRDFLQQAVGGRESVAPRPPGGWRLRSFGGVIE